MVFEPQNFMILEKVIIQNALFDLVSVIKITYFQSRIVRYHTY